MVHQAIAIGELVDVVPGGERRPGVALQELFEPLDLSFMAVLQPVAAHIFQIQREELLIIRRFRRKARLQIIQIRGDLAVLVAAVTKTVRHESAGKAALTCGRDSNGL